MISSLRGALIDVDEQRITLEVGGIGFDVTVSAAVQQHLPGLGVEFFVFTHLVVRDDAFLLYGFNDQDERKLYRELLKVSGIGPRLALNAISALSVEILQSAIANDQPEVIARIPGIGRKTAEKVIFQMKDKIEISAVLSAGARKDDTEVIAALTGLGYSLVEAQRAVQVAEAAEGDPIEEQILAALQYLGSN